MNNYNEGLMHATQAQKTKSREIVVHDAVGRTGWIDPIATTYDVLDAIDCYSWRPTEVDWKRRTTATYNTGTCWDSSYRIFYTIGSSSLEEYLALVIHELAHGETWRRNEAAPGHGEEWRRLFARGCEDFVIRKQFAGQPTTDFFLPDVELGSDSLHELHARVETWLKTASMHGDLWQGFSGVIATDITVYEPLVPLNPVAPSSRQA